MKILSGNGVMVVGVIAVLISPVLFTRASYWKIFDFSETGQIGDTIGGITAPIVGLVSIILLYLTLREQRSFNSRQIVDNRINQLLMIQNDLNALSEMTTYKLTIDNHTVSEKGFLNLGKLSQTNSLFQFDYLELNSLFRSCVLARVLCEQIRKFSEELDESAKTSFNSFTLSYLNSIYKFLNVIERNNILGNLMDSYADEELGSEVGNLLDDISQEIKTLKQELKQYKS
jgi:hypothetical protein